MMQWMNGWRLTGLLAVLLGVMVLGIDAAGGFSSDSIRMAARATARTSLLLFLPVFAASALAQFAPGRSTAWLLRNRRYLGVGFAASHGLHAVTLAVFAARDPALFADMTNLVTFIGGGSTYLFILLMAATSFDRAVRVLGLRNWRILHRIGVWYIAITFIATNAGRLPDMPVYWAVIGAILLAMALRLASWRRGRRTA